MTSTESRILVVNGNDIDVDFDCCYLSRMTEAVEGDVAQPLGYTVLRFTGDPEETHPEPMLVTLLGQLFEQSDVALPYLESEADLRCCGLVYTLQGCIKARLQSKPLLCIIDGIQYYEDGAAPNLTRHALRALTEMVDLAHSGLPLKLLITGAGRCRHVTNSSRRSQVLNVEDMIGLSNSAAASG